PIVGPQGIPGTPAAPNDVSPDAKATIESGSAPTERDLTGQQSERLPLATETRQPADATAASSARPLPVVSPLARAEAPLTTLTTATLAAERGDGEDRSTVARPESRRGRAVAAVPGTRAGAQARSALQPPTVTATAPGHRLPVSGYASPTVLPIVRERMVREVSVARMDRRKPLPLGAATALPAQVSEAELQQSGARAQPAVIDIDGIVHKVERRFMRRLAVEAERRRVKRWP
ncbi:MAG: hypothetical protein ACR2RB_13590, partial [Gammaproteobacteria bacterium]